MDHTTSPGPVAAGRRRFWVTVILFACANCLAWVGYHQYATSRLHLLRVLRFEPGPAAQVGARPTLSWQFNLDVAHDRGANGAEAPGTITPRVDGTWLWHDGHTLTFTPAADLPRATRFTVALSPQALRTADGIRLDKPFAESFSTEALHLRAARQAGFDQESRLVVELEFDDSVLPADVLSHLTLKDPTWRPMACRAMGHAAGKVVRVQTDPVGELKDRQGAFVFVQLSGGLAGTSGPLGTTGEFAEKVAITTELAATEALASVERHGGASVTLRFNSDEVDAELVRQVLSVEPALPYRVSRDYRGVRLTGNFEPGARYAIKLAKPPAGAVAKNFPRADVLSVFVPDRPAEVWFEHTAGYLGSQGNRALLAHAINAPDVTVTVTRLYDNNLVQWRTSSGTSHRGDDPAPLAEPVARKTLHVGGGKNARQDVRLSLDELLPPTAPRDGVYRVALSTGGETTGRHARMADDEGDDGAYGIAAAVVTLSDIGLTAKQSADAVTVWAVSLKGARPMENVRLRLFSNKNQALGEAVTNADGLATFKGVRPAKGEQAALVLAETAEGARLAGDAQPAAGRDGPGRNLTWLDLRAEQVDLANFDTGGKPYVRSGFEAFCYTERGVYRPGEHVRLRAIVRGPNLAVPGRFPVRWQLRRPDLRDWRSETVTLDGDGAAGLELDLPDDVATGRWVAELSLPAEPGGKSAPQLGSVAFQVEEFMPNRMKVALEVRGPDDVANPKRVSIGQGTLRAEVRADYLFGKPVAERPATLTLRVEPTAFAPAEWAGWTFNDAANTAPVLAMQAPTGGRIELPEQTLDADGHAMWSLSADELLNPAAGRKGRAPTPPLAYVGPWRVTLFGAVTEAGGRAVNTTRVVDVDRLAAYVAVRARKAMNPPGEPALFDVANVGADGKVLASETTLHGRLYHDTWNTTLVQEEGRYRYQSTRKLTPAGDEFDLGLRGGRAPCAVTPETGGDYVLIVRDVASGALTSCRFVASEGAWQDNVSRERPEQLEVSVAAPSAAQQLSEAVGRFDLSVLGRLWHGQPLVPEAATLRPGGGAQVTVRAPFAGRLLLSVETDAVLWSRVIEMPASHVVVPVELPRDCAPNAYVTATVVRAIDANAPWRTHRAYGVARVAFDNADRKLAVAIDAPKETLPARTLPVTLTLTDAEGHPAANAAVTLAAVDEGILSLTDFRTPNPFAFFTSPRALGVAWCDVYGFLMPELARPQNGSDVGGDKGDGKVADGPGAGRHQTPVTAKRVRPVAVLYPGVLHADVDGVVHADLNVPQFTGQLRLIAVGYGAHAFGSADRAVYVRSPLLVQSDWPRFAAPGDGFSVPFTVFNNTASAGKVELDLTLASRGGAPLSFHGGEGAKHHVTTDVVPAGGQTTVWVDVNAEPACGVASVHLTASMGENSFAEDVEVPVRPASPMISVGGFARATTTQPATVEVTDGFLEGTASLQLRATTRPTLELPRGLDYLERYPYGCAEQTISGAFPLIALGDIGREIAPGVFSPVRVEEKLQSGIVRLIGMQTADGGLSMWPGRDQASWPWTSVYGLHLLVEAEAAGHAVPADFRDHLMGYVRELLNRATDKGDVVEAQAYACYVMARAGRAPRNVMSRLGEILTKGPVRGGTDSGPAAQARFHLAAAWLAAGRRDLAAGLIPQTLPRPGGRRQLGGNLSSPVRERAIVLSTLLAVDPERPDLAAIAQEIADAGRERGYASTQDAAFAVMALGKYLRQQKAEAAYASATLEADGATVAEAVEGRPLMLERSGAAAKRYTVRVAGQADARAYVSWLQSGVPVAPPADEDAGLSVRRRYLTPRGEPVSNNTVRTGDLVQVELTLESATALANVVVDDLLPAGLDVENARLATSADEAQVEQKAGELREVRIMPDRVDVRDDRVILVASVPAGRPAKFTYLARATGVGAFVIPPVRGECMYDIGTHSLHGGGKRLTVLSAKAGGVAGVE